MVAARETAVVEGSGGRVGVSELRDVLQSHQRTGRTGVVPDVCVEMAVFRLSLYEELVPRLHLKYCWCLGVLGAM